MKKLVKLLSVLLAVVLLLPAIPFSASAADVNRDVEIQNLYLKTAYNTPEEKVASMTLMLEEKGYRLYVDEVSGEVACVEIATGAILLSNPYDVASCGGSDATKKEILSQIVIQYTENGGTKYLYSFEEAAMREQIAVKRIKGGVRLEYIIGREESRKLVPRWITDENFQKFIVEPMEKAVADGSMTSSNYKKLMTYYTKQDLEAKTSQRAKDQLLRLYPICAEKVIWTFEPNASTVELNWIESQIKAYCSEYTFEQMDADHEETGYKATDDQFPVFKLALEYSLTDHGMTVRLPCNGLRYDMTVYTLENISILPYLGAGNSLNASKTDDLVDYNFYPDGSGALFDFTDLNLKTVTQVRGKVYGLDYAYHEISGLTNQKVIRTPIYGTVASEKIYDYRYITKAGKVETLSVSTTVKSKEAVLAELSAKGATLQGEPTLRSYQRGYFAVIEAGESLAEIETYHAGPKSRYNTMINYFNPKPKDSYRLNDAVSVSGSSANVTVVSERKYTGSIIINYTLLNDPNIAEAAKAEDPAYTYYNADWFGMAEAYRDALEASGKLKRLTKDDLEDDIPLYLDVFGAIRTEKTVLTIPVKVMTPLTTTDDLLAMYESLSQNGVGNINFKLTGFANGGIFSTVPSSLKWENAIGGKSGIKELIAKAKEVNESNSGDHLGIYPDFDFAYIKRNKSFDDTNLKKDAVRTIDNRYTSYRQYSATLQSYVSFWQLAISPSRYNKFYEKLIKNYTPYGLDTMSVSTLGNALNSDFDEEDPYNREDSKSYTQKAFADLEDAGFHLMTEGGNSYTWAYVDHILDLPLDSSRYVKSSASVPFLGVVLHGYVQFAGGYLNEEGDTDYAILRAIENGAGISFLLSYRNTNLLKESNYLSQYYSVRYDIWEEDVIELYNELNGLLADVQDKVIVGHEFLVGERVLDADELKAKTENDLLLARLAEEAREEAERSAQLLAIANSWSNAQNLVSDIRKILKSMTAYNEAIGSEANKATLNDKISLLATKEELQEALALLGTDETTSAGFDDVIVTNLTKATVGDLAKSVTQAEKVLKTLTNSADLLSGMANLSALVKSHYLAKIDALTTELSADIATANGVLARELDDEKELSSDRLALVNSLHILVAKAEKIRAYIEDKDDAETFLSTFNNSLDSIGIFLTGIATDYNRVQVLKEKIADLIAVVEAGNEAISSSSLESSVKSTLKSRISSCVAEAKTLLAEASTLAAEQKSFLEKDLIATAVAKSREYTLDASLSAFCKDHELSADAIFAAAILSDDTDDDLAEEEQEAIESNNRLVAVTYGERDAKTFAKKACKTFLLNYNDYAVVVEYAGRTYTVKSGGYVVVND